MSNFFNKTPYTDFHELNLDWLLERVNNIKDHVQGMQDDIIYLQEHTPDMDDYYDKTETDALLANKADVSDLPDMTDYYDKTETDALLADKADVSDLPDMTDYYDKTETDTLLNAKANISSLATVATTGAYSDLSGTPDVYTKTESDSRYLAAPVKLLEVARVSTSETDYYLSETMQHYRFLLFAGAWSNGTDTVWMLVPVGIHNDPFYMYLNNSEQNSYYVVQRTDSSTKITVYSSNNHVTMRIYGIK